MRLGFPRFLKPFLYAVVALLLIVCALEIGLRVQDSLEWRAARPETDGDGLVVPSWTVHHELKPLRRVEFVNPDDEVPVVVRTSSFGTRGGEPTVPKPTNTFRIMVLGDETVLGPDVSEEATLTSRLADLLKGRGERTVEVVNAGVPGDCPLLSYLRFRHSLGTLRPDILVVSFDPGDIADDYRLRRHVEVADDNVPVACPNPMLRRLENAGVRGDERFLLPEWAKQRIAEWTKESSGQDDVRAIDSPRGRYGWLQERREDWDVYVDLAFTAFEHLSSACNEIGCELVVVAHPAPWQASSKACCTKLRESLGVGAEDFYRGRDSFDRLGAYLAKRGIAYCDGSEAFRAEPRPESLFLVNAPRLSKQGHELYARILATYLIRRVPGPWTVTPVNPTTEPRPRQARLGDATGR